MSGDACTTAGSNGIASSPLSVSSSSGSNNERAILPELQQIKEKAIYSFETTCSINNEIIQILVVNN